MTLSVTQNGPPPAVSARQMKQQIEELKMRVLDLAEHHMEISMRILKNWISTSRE